MNVIQVRRVGYPAQQAGEVQDFLQGANHTRAIVLWPDNTLTAEVLTDLIVVPPGHQ